jgi:hypothetical protein
LSRGLLARERPQSGSGIYGLWWTSVSVRGVSRSCVVSAKSSEAAAGYQCSEVIGDWAEFDAFEEGAGFDIKGGLGAMACALSFFIFFSFFFLFVLNISHFCPIGWDFT